MTLLQINDKLWKFMKQGYNLYLNEWSMKQWKELVIQVLYIVIIPNTNILPIHSYHQKGLETSAYTIFFRLCRLHCCQTAQVQSEDVQPRMNMPVTACTCTLGWMYSTRTIE